MSHLKEQQPSSFTDTEFVAVGDFYVSKQTASPRGSEDVIILLGWSDSKLRHMQKYASYYITKGCRVVVFLSKLSHFYSLSDKAFITLFKPLVPVLKDLRCLQGQEKRALVHIFSNGGAYSWYGLTSALDIEKKKLNLFGMVLDSSPSKMSLAAGMEVFTMPYKYRIVKLLMKPVFAALLLFSSCWSAVTFSQSSFGRLWSSVLRTDYRSPRLFLYSKTDKLIPYQDVEECIQTLLKSGCEVRSQRWETSEHVKHFVNHHDEYILSLDAFLAKTLVRTVPVATLS